MITSLEPLHLVVESVTLPPSPPPPLAPLGAPAAAATAPDSVAYATPVVAKKQQISPVDIDELAQDMALFGATDFTEVLRLYNITAQEFEHLRDTSPVYKAADRHIKEQLAQDPHLAIRRKAKAFLSARVSTLNSLATSEVVEPSARLKAIAQLVSIAGLDEKRKDDISRGVAVSINFGASVGAGLSASMRTPEYAERVYGG